MPDNAINDSDTPMTRTYIKVMLVEAVIILLLWVFGRLYS